MEVRQREDARNNYVRGLQHEGCSTWVAARELQHEIDTFIPSNFLIRSARETEQGSQSVRQRHVQSRG